MILKLFSIILVLTKFNFGFSLFSNEREFLNSRLRISDDYDIPIQLNITDNYARFFALGDWGGVPFFPFRTLVQENTAFFMSDVCNKVKCHFQLGIGDNFYFDGVKSVNDSRFKTSFEDVFRNKEIPWFFVLGNHDYLGDPHAQIEYTQMSKRWILPNYNYSISVNLNRGKDKLIYFLMIDTVRLCETTMFKDRADNHKIKNLNVSHENHDYFQEIEKNLQKISVENYPYVIVVGHYPVWSVAEHGPTKCLVNNLRPLLHKYKVNAYFAGHEHDMEHLTHTYMNSTVEYIVSGITNLPYYSNQHIDDVPKDSLKYYWSDGLQIHGALALVEADFNSMNITYYKTDGRKLYEIKIDNKYKI